MTMCGYDGSHKPEEYFKEVSDALSETDYELLDKIIDEILLRKDFYCTIFTAGNGGSSATASHLINDLVKGCKIYGREGFRAFSLSDPTALITCLANDFSYEDIYSIMLKTFARPGDLLIVFSGSGNSPNILRACEMARNIGMTVIAFGGRDGGKMKDLADYTLIAPTNSMEQIEDIHMVYNHAIISSLRKKLKHIWDMEIINYPKPSRPKYAIFDFDGTVSLIREGWQPIMYDYFTEELLKCPDLPEREDVRKIVVDFVDYLTGKQTIFQCMRLAEEIRKYGGSPNPPLDYKAEYLRRLEAHTRDRINSLKNGGDPTPFIVPGARDFLTKLRDNGVTCYLTSGTDEEDVIEEAKLLGLDGFFEEIHGATDLNSTLCSKEQVLDDLIQKKNLAGSDLVVFGDGYVEIELGHRLNSYTVAVATDEENKDTSINEWKRDRLIKAGADCVIPDFKNSTRIYDFIWR